MPMPESIIPIKVKKAFTRAQPPNYKKIEGQMHRAMEWGGKAERKLNDAIHALQQAKVRIMNQIKSYISKILGCNSALPPLAGKIPPLIAAVVDFISKIKDYITEIMDLITALIDCIQMLVAFLKRIMAYIQSLLNAIANIMNQICNLRLPRLPSLPNLFGLFGKFRWSGYSFPKGSLKLDLKFDVNFAFGACKLRSSKGPGLLANQPKNISSALGLPSTQPTYSLPQGGQYVDPTKFGDAADGTYTSQVMAEKSTPYFSPDFDPTKDMYGSLPQPLFIVSGYELPHDEYEKNLLSLVGNPGDGTGSDLAGAAWQGTGIEGSGFDYAYDFGDGNGYGNGSGLTDLNSAGTSIKELAKQLLEVDQDEANLPGTGSGFEDHPDAPVDFSGLTDANNPFYKVYQEIQKDARAYQARYVSLLNIVLSNYNKHITAAWVIAVHNSRTEREGLWLEQYQAVYEQWVLPSYQFLQNNPIPWHVDPKTGKPLDGLVVPLVSLIRDAATPEDQNQILYLLSWIEASMLGYPRETRWDASVNVGAHADLVNLYARAYTKSDLDFVHTAVEARVPAVTILLDQGGKALHPTSISVPTYLETKVRAVIKIGSLNIEAHPEFRTSDLKFRYVYNAYAEVQEIDHYSQYWREFAGRWNDFLNMEVPLLEILQTYTEAINSYVNPLADRHIYDWIRADYINKNPQFNPATTSLTAPIVKPLELNPYIISGPEPGPNGEAPVNGYSSGQFDPVEYLQRPDIQALSPNAQLRMVTLAQAYADVDSYGKELEAETNARIAELQQEVAQSQADVDTLNAYVAELEANNNAKAETDVANAVIGYVVVPGIGKLEVKPNTSILHEIGFTPPEPPGLTEGGKTPLIRSAKVGPFLLAEPVSLQLTAVGGVGSPKWSITKGTLPAGLSINQAGKITGTPTTKTSGDVEFTVTDRKGSKSSKTFTVAVKDTLPLHVITQSLPDGTVGLEYSEGFDASGGKEPYVWSTDKPLPAGLSLDPATGVVSGTPGVPSTGSVVATVKSACGKTATGSVTYKFTAPTAIKITSNRTIPVVVGKLYVKQLKATGGNAPYTWSCDNLPAGLKLAPSTGLITGTPTEASDEAFSIKVKDSSGAEATKVLKQVDPVRTVKSPTLQ